MKFWKQFKLYESEMDQFLNGLKAQDPSIEADQLAGRARLWDKAPLSLDEQDRTKTASVKQQPYVYLSK
jgi:hypothetical protein